MHHPPRIKRLSIWTSRALLVLIVITIIVPTWFWIFVPTAELLELDEVMLAKSFLHGAALTLPKQVMGWIITMFPISFLLYAMVKLRRVFREYAKGRVFSLTAVKSLRSVGVSGCAMVIAQFFVTPLMSLAMTYDFAPGSRELSIGVGITSSGILGLFSAIMFLVLAWVMTEARENADDLSQIV